MRLWILFLVLVALPLPFSHAYDNQPWINAFMFDNVKPPGAYTDADAQFIADHFDLATGHLQLKSAYLLAHNPDAKRIPFTGLAEFGTFYQSDYARFLALNPGAYSAVEIEDAYIHYQCDVVVAGVLYPGCNRVSSSSNACTGSAAAGCSASTAVQRSQSRAPDLFLPNWLLVYPPSRAYRDFAAWKVKEVLGFYPSNAPAQGMFWDNVLVGGDVIEIDKTIEYFGQPAAEWHQHNLDQGNFYLTVKPIVQQAFPNAQLWLGNVNAMFWIRGGGPRTSWALNNLAHMTPESWVSPLGAGENNMPSWQVDCSDMAEAWSYSVTDPHQISLYVHTYNTPQDSNSLRTRAFSIAKYYLVKNPRLYYGYSDYHTGLDNGVHVPYSEWNPMADINIGQPRTNPAGVRDFQGQTGTDKFFNWLAPTVTESCAFLGRREAVFARHFQNGLVLSRWKANRCSGSSAECASYVDPISYPLANAYNPGGSYYQVQTDGSLSASPVTSVTLRTNEAALLVNACAEGQVPSGTTCACGGQLLGGGQWCCANAPKSVCTSDAECKIQGSNYVCQNPNSCQASCALPAPVTCTSQGGQCLSDCTQFDSCTYFPFGSCQTGLCCMGACTAPVITCPDGTADGQCSTTQPLQCQNGVLVNNCLSCGCAEGFACNSGTGACTPVAPADCQDGTQNGQCSVVQPQYCQNGLLSDNCAVCGCASGYSCNTGTGSCLQNSPSACPDGTLYGACSATQPLECQNGLLVNNCVLCGCAPGFSCNSQSNACDAVPLEPPNNPPNNGGGGNGGSGGSGNSGDGNSGGSSSGGSSSVTPTPSPSVFPDVFGITPTPTLSWNDVHQQTQADLAELEGSGENTQDIQLLLTQAQQAKAQGQTGLATRLLAQARKQLDAVLIKVRAARANATWPYVLTALLVIVAAAVFFSSTLRLHPPKPPGTGTPVEPPLTNDSERLPFPPL